MAPMSIEILLFGFSGSTEGRRRGLRLKQSGLSATLSSIPEFKVMKEIKIHHNDFLVLCIKMMIIVVRDGMGWFTRWELIHIY